MVPQLILIPSSPIDSSEYWRTTQSICPKTIPTTPSHCTRFHTGHCAACLDRWDPVCRNSGLRGALSDGDFGRKLIKKVIRLNKNLFFFVGMWIITCFLWALNVPLDSWPYSRLRLQYRSLLLTRLPKRPGLAGLSCELRVWPLICWFPSSAFEWMFFSINDRYDFL